MHTFRPWENTRQPKAVVRQGPNWSSSPQLHKMLRPKVASPLSLVCDWGCLNNNNDYDISKILTSICLLLCLKAIHSDCCSSTIKTNVMAKSRFFFFFIKFMSVWTSLHSPQLNSYDNSLTLLHLIEIWGIPTSLIFKTLDFYLWFYCWMFSIDWLERETNLWM